MILWLIFDLLNKASWCMNVKGNKTDVPRQMEKMYAQVDT